ncbi:hypothetical protein B0H15DRAFT_538224 [Mycena belliarum]|uniref:Uncharacterized protein n=1 Tax=Mycena belliarum TaxID=1033014 RepID=A0AAD6TSP0_9AGAR|nr:hypothetical protein B0H15DRAFT_538224 [Mycena belliae]
MPPKTVERYERLGSDKFDRMSEEDCEAQYRAMQRARKLALRPGASLKTGFQCTLRVVTPPPNPDPQARPLPALPATSDAVVFELVDALRAGVDQRSQVWTAKIVSVPETLLVLKIIQPSLCPIPHPDNDNDWLYYDHPDDLAPWEAWGYGKLRSLQGRSIPYFFGSGTITTPSKEKADVLILEHIPGPTLYEVALVGPDLDRQESITAGVQTTEDIFEAGVTRDSLQPSKFILTGPPGARSVVALSFYMTYIMRPDSSEKKEMFVNQAATFIRSFRTVVADEEEDEEVVEDFYKWVRENVREDLRKEFSVTK